MSIKLTGKKQFLGIAFACFALSACSDPEEEARTLLSEALGQYQVVQDDSLAVSERMAALDQVENRLSKISDEYATTDVGLQLASQETFGVLDPQELPELREDLLVLQEIESCAENPASRCVRAMLEQRLEDEPDGLRWVSQSMQPMAAAYRATFDASVRPQDVAVGDDARQAKLMAAVMSIASGEHERAGEFIYAQLMQERIEPSSARAAVLYPIAENLSYIVPDGSDSAFRQAIRSLASDEFEATEDPVAGLLSEVLSDEPDYDRIGEFWDAIPSNFSADMPLWLQLSFALSDPESEQYETVVTSGLSDFQLDDIDPELARTVAVSTLERGRDIYKGELLWHAAQIGITDSVLQTAEEIGGTFENRGYFAAALGARQLGYEGGRETFDRILAMMEFPGAQEAGEAMVERNFAFGQALAGDIASLQARDDVDPSIIALAEILEGVPPSETSDIFGYEIDQRMTPVGEEGLARARAFTWYDRPDQEALRLASQYPGLFLQGFEWGSREEKTDIAAYLNLLSRLDGGLSSQLMAAHDDPSEVMTSVSLDEAPIDFYLAMLTNLDIANAGAMQSSTSIAE